MKPFNDIQVKVNVLSAWAMVFRPKKVSDSVLMTMKEPLDSWIYPPVARDSGIYKEVP